MKWIKSEETIKKKNGWENVIEKHGDFVGCITQASEDAEDDLVIEELAIDDESSNESVVAVKMKLNQFCKDENLKNKIDSIALLMNVLWRKLTCLLISTFSASCQHIIHPSQQWVRGHFIIGVCLR